MFVLLRNRRYPKIELYSSILTSLNIVRTLSIEAPFLNDLVADACHEQSEMLYLAGSDLHRLKLDWNSCLVIIVTMSTRSSCSSLNLMTLSIYDFLHMTPRNTNHRFATRIFKLQDIIHPIPWSWWALDLPRPALQHRAHNKGNDINASKGEAIQSSGISLVKNMPGWQGHQRLCLSKELQALWYLLQTHPAPGVPVPLFPWQGLQRYVRDECGLPGDRSACN